MGHDIKSPYRLDRAHLVVRQSWALICACSLISVKSTRMYMFPPMLSPAADVHVPAPATELKWTRHGQDMHVLVIDQSQHFTST